MKNQLQTEKPKLMNSGYMVTPEMHGKIKAWAIIDDRSASSLVRKILNQAIEDFETKNGVIELTTATTQ